VRSEVLILLVCASSLSCSTHMPSVAPDQRPTGKEAIVYGKFELSGSAAYCSIALVIHCQDGREYRIRFDDREPIVVLATAPSTCWLDQMLHLDWDNSTLKKTALPDPMRHPIRLDAGRAYYLGDFSGTITYESELRETAQLKDVRNEFSATTQEFRQKFPKLQGIMPVDLVRPTDD
jgi:hypothetical protein